MSGDTETENEDPVLTRRTNLPRDRYEPDPALESAERMRRYWDRVFHELLPEPKTPS
jgi:hypothetical protein